MAFVPFFVGLYQASKMLGYARRDEVFSPRATSSIRHSAMLSQALSSDTA